MIEISGKMIVKENNSLTILPTKETDNLDKNSEVEVRENNDIVEEIEGWVLIYIVILVLFAMKYYRKWEAKVIVLLIFFFNTEIGMDLQ